VKISAMNTDAWCGTVALSETDFHMMPVLLISNVNRCVWRHDTGMSTIPPKKKVWGHNTWRPLYTAKSRGNTSPCPSTPMQIYRKAYPYRLSPSYSRTTSMATLPCHKTSEFWRPTAPGWSNRLW